MIENVGGVVFGLFVYLMIVATVKEFPVFALLVCWFVRGAK